MFVLALVRVLAKFGEQIVNHSSLEFIKRGAIFHAH
jgi:hypothetical protein